MQMSRVKYNQDWDSNALPFDFNTTMPAVYLVIDDIVFWFV